MTQKTETRHATVDGKPVVEVVTYEEVADGPDEDPRSRLHDDGKYWRWVSISNPLVDMSKWGDAPEHDDDLVWGSDNVGISKIPLTEGTKIVTEHEYDAVVAVLDKTRQDQEHARVEQAQGLAEERRNRYKRNGWSEADLDAEFGPVPKKGR